VSDAGAGAAPGTPPVTLIESSFESSLFVAGGADAAGGGEFVFAGSLRIESPTVPEPIAVPVIGALTPSCAHDGDANAIATIAVATTRNARLTWLGFFTVFLRRDFGLHLRMKLKNARLGMSGKPHSRHFQSVAQDSHQARRFDPVVIRHKGC
jgi:hypothetical protein